MKQLLFFILTLFVLTLSAQIQEIGYFSNSGDSLFLAKMNNKYGIINRKGNWLVKPIWNDVGTGTIRHRPLIYRGINGNCFSPSYSWRYTANYYRVSYFYHHELIRISYEPFYNQLFRKNIHLRYKLKTTENKLVNKRKINPSLYLGEYTRVVKNEKIGLTNFDGEMILPCIYNQILRDKDLFLVQKDSLWEVLTSNMKSIFSEKFQTVDILSNHFFRLKKKGKWGVKTINDKEIIPFEYDKVWEKFGLFILKKNDQWGIVDQKGNLVKLFEYDQISYIKEGYFFLYQKDKKGVVDTLGKEIISVMYDDVFFDNKMFEVEYADKYGVLNAKGEEVIPIKYESITLEKKYVFAQTDTTILVFDYQGKLLSSHVGEDFEYDSYENPQQFYVEKEDWGAVGVVDVFGKEFFPCIYEGSEEIPTMFFEYFYVHKKESKLEIIVNQKGSIGEYNNFYRLPHPYIAVQKKNKWGVINYMTNKEIIPFEYISFSPIKHHTGYHPLIYNKQSQSFIVLAQIDQKTCHVINQKGEILVDSINYKQDILDINWGDDMLMIRQGTGILFISVDQLGVHSKFHDYKY